MRVSKSHVRGFKKIECAIQNYHVENWFIVRRWLVVSWFVDLSTTYTTYISDFIARWFSVRPRKSWSLLVLEQEIDGKRRLSKRVLHWLRNGVPEFSFATVSRRHFLFTRGKLLRSAISANAARIRLECKRTDRAQVVEVWPCDIATTIGRSEVLRLPKHSCEWWST